MKRLTALLILGLVCGLPVFAAELHPPAQVIAGTAFSIQSSGSGEATFYLIGPAVVSKRKIQLGSDIAVQPEEVERAGRYTAIACDGSCTASVFTVQATTPFRVSLLVHPSRVPVDDPNSMSAVAFVFDRFHNLVMAPQPVNFNVVPRSGSAISEQRETENGVAWIRMSSGRQEGAVKIGATVGKADELRVVQQIAADACNLKIKGEWNAHNFFVETDPVRDCAGNNVPDGTVVSFTKMDADGKTTVDVPIKKGIAKVQMPIVGSAHITVASGVVTGNELSVAGGGQ